MPWIKNGTGRLLGRHELAGQSGLLAVRLALVDNAGLGRLVESGSELAECRARLVFLAAFQSDGVGAFQTFQPRFDGAILEALAVAVAHAAGGGLGIRHKSSCFPFRKGAN